MKLQQAIIASAIALAVPLVPLGESNASEVENSDMLPAQVNEQRSIDRQLQSEPDRLMDGWVRIRKGSAWYARLPFTAKVFEQQNGDLIVELDYSLRRFVTRVERLNLASLTFAKGMGQHDDLLGYYFPSSNSLRYWSPTQERGEQSIRVVRDFIFNQPLFE